MIYFHPDLYNLTPDYEFKIFVSANNNNSNSEIYKISLAKAIERTEVKQEFIKNIDEIKILVDELTIESFLELKDLKIRFEPLNDQAFYFESNFNFSTLFKKDIEYVLRINPDIYHKDCPKDAVKAILAHELSHISDYQNGGLTGIMNIGFKMLSKKSLEQYEHRTDLQAIYHGYGLGLIEYREWVYNNISAKDLQIKKATYYTPDEINSLINIFAKVETISKKEELMKYWLNNPPIGISQINKGLRLLDK